jgi:iron uptake system component EfeO
MRSAARRAPALVMVAGAALAACGSGSDSGTEAAADTSNATTINVSLTSGGCVADPAGVASGPVTFKVKNTNASSGTEVELLNSSGKILGEKENLTPGLSGSFSLRLAPGTYEIYCPNTKKQRSPFTVTGAAATAPSEAPTSDAATAAYRAYVIAQVNELVTNTKAFTAAVAAGDVAKAKQLYASTRYNYETIEPVAESFGDLDPDIDARENDVENPAQWSGFHKIEKALYQQNTLAGMAPYATKLEADFTKLQHLVAKETYQPAQLANGAVELLDEVAKSKVTGEEERYSHTDLWDFAANVEGARKAYALLEPTLQAKNATLATTITTRFNELQAKLATYKSGDGYVNYSTVTDAQRRQLAQAVDALAEPLSQVAALVS